MKILKNKDVKIALDESTQDDFQYGKFVDANGKPFIMVYVPVGNHLFHSITGERECDD